jgi:hypothetical protein
LCASRLQQGEADNEGCGKGDECGRHADAARRSEDHQQLLACVALWRPPVSAAASGRFCRPARDGDSVFEMLLADVA